MLGCGSVPCRRDAILPYSPTPRDAFLTASPRDGGETESETRNRDKKNPEHPFRCSSAIPFSPGRASAPRPETLGTRGSVGVSSRPAELAALRREGSCWHLRRPRLCPLGPSGRDVGCIKQLSCSSGAGALNRILCDALTDVKSFSPFNQLAFYFYVVVFWEQQRGHSVPVDNQIISLPPLNSCLIKAHKYLCPFTEKASLGQPPTCSELTPS